MAEPARQQEKQDRFCPGEEQIRISEAICIGRRRVNYHKCRGCQFNDDEKGAASEADGTPGERTAAEAEDEKRRRIERIFKAYDIRGFYPDVLDAEIAWRVGHAVAQVLRSELRGYDRSLTEKAAVVVGRDMRPGSTELTQALTEGLRAAGSPVIDIGMIDTPQLYFAVNHLTCCGGVQVTASHNPAPWNGFKICGQRARPVSADTGLTKIYRIARNTIRHASAQRAGMEQADLSEPYKAFVRGFLETGAGVYNAERPLRVVVDASNGMAGRWLTMIFGDVPWLEVVRLNFTHNGRFVHDPDPLVEANLAQLKDRVIRSKAHLGVCFDGDADRCIFVDAQGQAAPADLVTVLLARRWLEEVPGSTVVYDLRSSRVVPEEIARAGGVPRRERCGHPFIRKALADTKGIFGGELSGHYYFRDNWCCDSAMIAFADVLNILTRTGKPLHELVAPLKRHARSGERNFEQDRPEDILDAIARRYEDAEIDFLDGVTVRYRDWWFNVRISNTEPLIRLNAEAADEKLLASKLAELYPLLGKPVGE